MLYTWYYGIDMTDIDFAKETLQVLEDKLIHFKSLEQSDDINNKIKRINLNINCIKYTYSL
tara:strand:+ start:1943 stop:2125 length:183 start_codon:yes stop_codon:yes gene_type:complete